MSDLESKSEHSAVVRSICKANENRFNVLCNLDSEKYYVAGLFPDVILEDKTTGKPAFIIEVKKNGNIARCIQQWKSVPAIPATLYIIVPEYDLDSAKSIAQVIGLKTKFGSYRIPETTGGAIVAYDK